ncbi:hypothetical protein RN001_008906 [Aquatica leii]|uniref:Ankyrin repeat domain-containing protein 39 n=1 Tax=Aquatica leii TaxID=1421715 RepID=A0AAN7Q5H4_9COLE|nr:hypothetical protein RN001_008906 [Aquatica leii]
MSNCDHYDEQHQHICQGHMPTSSVCQTIDELDFERGIWYAAQNDDLDRVQKLIAKGTDVDSRDSAGYTSLHYAARNGCLQVCKLLLKNGANINAATKSGCATALHRACTAGQMPIVQLLLSNNVDGLIKDADGKTALHRAAESKHIEICKVISSAYPELKDMVDAKGKLPKDYVQMDNLF